MRVLKIGDRRMRECRFCKERHEMVALERDIPVGDSIAKGIALVCEQTSEITFIPHQTVPDIKRARRALNARIPVELLDAFNRIGDRMERKCGAAPVARLYILEALRDPKVRQRMMHTLERYREQMESQSTKLWTLQMNEAPMVTGLDSLISDCGGQTNLLFGTLACMVDDIEIKNNTRALDVVEDAGFIG